jgi:hypothetical protein
MAVRVSEAVIATMMGVFGKEEGMLRAIVAAERPRITEQFDAVVLPKTGPEPTDEELESLWRLAGPKAVWKRIATSLGERPDFCCPECWGTEAWGFRCSLCPKTGWLERKAAVTEFVLAQILEELRKSPTKVVTGDAVTIDIDDGMVVT